MKTQEEIKDMMKAYRLRLKNETSKKTYCPNCSSKSLTVNKGTTSFFHCPTCNTSFQIVIKYY